MMEDFQKACSCLHNRTKNVLSKIPYELQETATDIVLRKNDALYVVSRNKICFIAADGTQCLDKQFACIITSDELKECILRACGYSMYAHKDELMKGYISLGNGCRMGLVGKFGVIRDTMADLSCIDAVKIRIARNIYTDISVAFDDADLHSVLVVGPPASGKTTFLRSIAKNIADGSIGRMYSVAVVDERNEIFPLGLCSSPCVDVISGIKKAEGINMAVRLFSPDIVICDEIGTLSEAQVIQDSMHCGVHFVCSMHADDEIDLYKRNSFMRLQKEKIFDRIIFLHGAQRPGEVKKVIHCKENIFA